MRPLALTLAGFRSHRDQADFVFEGRSLIAIVGPTGSGKSSILDGICFALYGRTPREQRATKRLICSRSDRAVVALRFQVDGYDHEVRRVLPRQGAGEHLLIDVSSGQRFSGEAEVNERIQALIGLDFNGFCSSVLLAQGRFDEFLSATPTDRTEILKGLFRLERIEDVRRAAQEELRTLELDLARLDGELATIPDDVQRRVKQARKDAQECMRRVQRLEAAVPEEERLIALRRTTEARLVDLGDRLRRVEQAAEGLPGADRLAALAEREERLAADAAAAEQAVTACEEALSSTRAERADASLGSEADLARLQETLASVQRLRSQADELAGRLDRVRARCEELGAAADAARDEADKAELRLREASDALRDLERAHAAHVLRETLSAGQPCPVCEQTVTRVPRAGGLPALDGARAAASEAEAQLHAARGSLQDAVGARDRELAEARHLSEALEDRRREIADGERRLADALGDVADPGAEIERRLQALREREARLRDASERLERARRRRDEVAASIRDAAAERTRLYGAVVLAAAACELPPPAGDDAQVLIPAVRRTVEAVRARIADLGERLDAARTEAQGAEAELTELRVSLGLEPGRTVTDALGGSRVEADVAARRAEELAEAARRRAELTEGRDRLVHRQELFERLNDDLRPSRFVTFLLRERTRALAELASERFRAMTTRYRFELDDRENLVVVDELAADQTRSVSSLSGGETFLASLALALALAELVAREGGRLECFFLDEGFGSLDPESFDMAMDGIEQLVTEDRLIGLVSHLDALKQRVEDKIVLERDADGNTIVARGAGPGA